MSVTSYMYAEYANKIKDKWVERLEDALIERDWYKIQLIKAEMQKFHFSE